MHKFPLSIIDLRKLHGLFYFCVGIFMVQLWKVLIYIRVQVRYVYENALQVSGAYQTTFICMKWIDSEHFGFNNLPNHDYSKI